jgi:hypothetical protein
MNTAITYNDLPPALRDVADLYAWGNTKKEIAMKRGKSFYTIDQQVRTLFEKAGVRKDTEFTAWYFCSRFCISFDLSPLKKTIISACFLALFSITFLHETDCFRVRASRSFRTSQRNLRRRTEDYIF